ncbi:MAG: hypothetical protein LBE76_02090 [Nitrososphaerota archaeon]|nr:hypothetical protein [Nitrososphaerota archaeon]
MVESADISIIRIFQILIVIFSLIKIKKPALILVIKLYKLTLAEIFTCKIDFMKVATSNLLAG